MKFSINCLAYKRVKLLEEAIYSVLQQTYQNFELLIINDYNQQTLYINHPKVRILNLDKKFQTLGEKRNFGVSQATGDLILQLDDDDLFMPDYLENLKQIIGDADFLFPQKPIMYFNDHSKIYLSPHPMTNTFLYRRDTIGNKYHYENKNFDELTSFYLNVKEKSNLKHIMGLLKPEQFGYIYRQDVDDKRKFAMGLFRTETIAEQNRILDSIKDKTGDIFLDPHWDEDYVKIIKENLKIVKTANQSQIEKAIGERRKIWNSVKDSWEKANKFIESANSRGIISTALNAAGVENDLGDRVSDELYNQRFTSCFGNNDKNIHRCDNLKYIEGKGSFCGSCGCGTYKLAQLDGEGYTKLHYPHLECPLKKPGFSNYDGNILSVVISVLNDNDELNNTIRSIRDTSPKEIEIIVIDDCSDVPVQVNDPFVKVFRQEKRMGAGYSKSFGVELSSSEYVLIIDAHMRFIPGWYETAINILPHNPKTLWCAICLGLNESNMDINNPKGAYYGADLVICDEKNRIFQGVWTKKKEEKNYEIPCVMGACYFVNKKWFISIGGVKEHKMWGSLEPLLSLKYWLSGGEVRLMSDVRIGHKFRNTAPYKTELKYIEYNKIRPLKLFLSDDVFKSIIENIPNSFQKTEALKLLEEERDELEKQKAEYNKIFIRDINWLIDKFDIEIPYIKKKIINPG